MRNDVIEHIGSCIWEARRHKGYSRRVLSEKTGLSERTIEKIEKGKVNTTAETLYTLINALDMSADYLFKMDKHQADVKCEQVINMIYGLDGKEFSVQEEDKQKDIFVDETTIRAILTERQFKRLTLYVIRGMTVEQIAEQEGVAHQNVSKSIRQAKKKIKFFFEKQGAKVPF